jgi:aconitate hydratase
MHHGTLSAKILLAHGAIDDETLVLRPAQVLLQDATGVLVMQALEAIGISRVHVPLAVQYVDHNIIQADNRNAEDHIYLRDCASAFGILFAGPGTGVSHAVHAERFGRPGAFLLGSDSHTCGAGSLAMIGIGAGSFDVAAVLADEPFRLPVPRIWRITLTGTLPIGVGAKDVILTLIGRYGVAGAKGFILEYDGPGIRTLGVMDRMAIANMGAEMGATSSVFPSDERTRAFLQHAGRGDDFVPLCADADAEYDETETLDLSALEPMIARPQRPDDVVPVREVAGTPVGQVYVGSSANPGFSDIARVAAALDGKAKAEGVSLDINPATRGVFLGLAASGHLATLVQAGARFHQIGCNGCNGMGQAPASGVNSLRTVPRNFPGRSGTADDRVWLCGPETAAAAALSGEITDPRSLGDVFDVAEFPPTQHRAHIAEPADHPGGTIRRGTNIARLQALPAIRGQRDLPVLLSLGDDISTDAISPAGVAALPLRSNPEQLAKHTFRPIDLTYPQRARAALGGHVIVAGRNMGQGSSREHAALCPRLLGLQAVIAESFARIFASNLVNAGILPLTVTPKDAKICAAARTVAIDFDAVTPGEPVVIHADGHRIEADHGLSPRGCGILAAGGLISALKQSRSKG